MKGSTAPIRKTGTGKKPWMLDCRYIGGKREWYQTRDEAEAARKNRLVEYGNHGTSAAILTTEDRLQFIRAKERLQMIGATLPQVLDFFERHHKSFTPMPLADAASQLYQLKLDTNKRERSADAFKYTVAAFAKSAGETRLVSEISREEIEKWLFRNGWSPYTIRTKLIDLQTFFRTAKARGWATQVPTDGIEKIELDDKPPGILTVEHCEKLLRAAEETRPQFCGFIALALFCGIRPDEIEGMHPINVQIERGFVEVPAEIAKTRERRIVELSENAKAWLNVGLVLPPKNARGNLNAVRRAAGFTGFTRKLVKMKETWVKTPGIEWPHDAMRHSFASYHLAMWGSADKTATQMGHRSTDMLFRHYRELVPKEDAERFWQILPK